ELGDIIDYLRLDILPECKRWVGHILDSSNVSLDSLYSSNWKPRLATGAACMQLTLGEAIADFCMASLFHVDDAELARCRLVKTIDAYTIAAQKIELQTLESVLPEIIKLRNATNITNQMITKKCLPVKVLRYANQNFKRLIYVIHRLFSDAWFEFTKIASETPFLPLLTLVVDTFVPLTDDGLTESDACAQLLGSRLTQVFVQYGAAIVASLNSDICRICTLQSKCAFDDAWAGLKLSEFSEAESVSLLCPAFSTFWGTPTRKLYLTNCQNDGCRSLVMIRACKVMREVVCRGFFPTSSLYLDYLKKTLDQRSRFGMTRLQSVAQEISSTCEEVGLLGMTVVGILQRAMKKAKTPETDEDRQTQIQFENDIRDAVAALSSGDGEKGGGAQSREASDPEATSVCTDTGTTCGADRFESSEPSNSCEASKSPVQFCFSLADPMRPPDGLALQRTVIKTPHWARDTLNFPLSFECSDNIYYQLAHPWARLEFLLISVMHDFLRKAILSSRYNPVSTSLEARVVARAAMATDPKYAQLPLSEIETRVCHVGAKAGQSILCGHRNAISDGVELPDVTILASQNCVVRFGIDTHDKFSSVCAEGLFRIKSYLSYGTPLPSGMSYKVSEPHRGSRAKKLT
ncbi:hypothetical protein N9S81_00465, partial [bacterium]|nr:hypothetical protein [bacterium]